MFTVEWLKDAGERAAKTFAQSLLGVVTVGQAITDVNWESGLAIAATATVVSVLTSVVSTLKGDPDSASVVK